LEEFMKPEQLIPPGKVPVPPFRPPVKVRRLEPGQARPLTDLFPPNGLPARIAPGPEGLVSFSGQLYFAVNRADGRKGLWKSNGTAAGTVPVKEFPAGPGDAFSSSLRELTVAGSQLFFFVPTAEYGLELWKSDGTAAGTALVKDLTPGSADSSLSGLTAAGAGVYFFRSFSETETTPARTELWKSNGTAAGTLRVKDLGPGSFTLQTRTTVGNILLFVVETPASGTELWRSDGTEAGTFLLKDIQPGSASAYPSNLRVAGGRVFFTAEDAEGRRVWRTDGTVAGTVRVEALGAGTSYDGLQLLGVVGSFLYLSTSNATDRRLRLYRLNVRVQNPGTARLVTTLPNPFAADPSAEPRVNTFTVAGDKLFFSMSISTSGPAPRDVQLWVTDGTRVGTRLVVRPLSLSDEFESELFTLDNRILFSAYEEGSAGLEPWISDGTPKGTRRLQDLVPGSEHSYPHSYTRVGSSVFFVANAGMNSNELWVMPLV
jgi:ELWxxDGT repeat protein